MQTEVLVVLELCGQRVRKGPYTHLYAVSVFYESGAVLSNQNFGRGWFREVGCNQRCIVAYEIVELVEADQIAESVRYVRIDYSDYQFRTFNGGYRAVYGCSQTDHSVGVRERYVDKGCAQFDESAAVEFLALSEMDRKVVRLTLIDFLADIRAYEETLLEEDAFILRFAIRSRAFGVEMVEVQICDISRIGTAA